ncbi:MAG: hypothetical protein KBT34_02045 [Prevotella sp.]|nr:hypothetical protein [Candidatus Prevotella equi]
MKKLLFILLTACLPLLVNAQRFTDKLDRGLVAMKTTKGVFVSWRIFGEEYYDVQYNLYRDGSKVNDEPLNVSNYMDASGTTSSSYTVKAVVKGVEQKESKAVKPWTTSYKEITLKHDGIKSTLVPNDACCADVDGDGELEVLMKFDNATEAGQGYPKNGAKVNGVYTNEHSIFEIFKLDGTRLWWVNCGPNMGDFQNNEQNIVGYDWNMDGKAEVLMRLAEGSTIHYADGSTYTIGTDGKNGTSWTNYRPTDNTDGTGKGGGANWFMCSGAEFLVYCNGETGQVFDLITYPLARLEPGETYEKAWGVDKYDGGHRASKFFFGAPYLDGRNPSIFLARGIYTQIKMCAYDVNKTTNKLMKRWDWRQTSGGSWMWQGYHNYAIADVDMDGRDEIIYGSMVIDDNGKGLSTTGLGHGDAQHCGDLNPFIHGLEQFACNEESEGYNYRDATTSKMYAAKLHVGSDIGRSMAGNFSNSYPGAQGCAIWGDPILSLVTNKDISLTKTGLTQNMRIYWDGDLLEECFNYSNGKNTAGAVYKVGSGLLYTCEGSMTNNDTKGTPCYQGDVLGDWREEIIMRTANNNIRIYSTPTPTTNRNYSLWHDHQYRNGMVWQMCGYNQPPHVSYFIGELEGITMAPPPLTMTDRTEVKNGGTVSSSLNDKHVIVCETGNTSVSIENGAKPYILTFNVPSWVQGTAGTNYTAKEATINYTYYTCNVTSGSLAGAARLVKQGDGILNLPKVDMTHSGNTDIWEGTLNFDGTMKNSDLWLNRFTTLNTDGGTFKSIKAQYDAKINPGGEGKIGTVNVTGNLTLDYGSRVVIDIDGANYDKLIANTLTLVKKTGTAWTDYGPEFIQPVVELRGSNILAGDYVIAECKTLEGAATNLKVIGADQYKKGLRFENGKLILTLGNTRGASDIVWKGDASNVWNVATAENFFLADDATKTPDVYVNGDAVTFNDEATATTINLTENIKPSAVVVSNETKALTISGEGNITTGSFTKTGKGTVTMSNLNTYTGINTLSGGTTKVSALSNSIDEKGNLGYKGKIYMSNGAVLQNTAAVTNGASIQISSDEGGVLTNDAKFTQEVAISGTQLTKNGSGEFAMNGNGSNLTRLVVKAGTLSTNQSYPAKTVEMQSGTLNLNVGSACAVDVPENRNATVRFTDGRGTYSNRIIGAGNATVWMTTANGTSGYAVRAGINGNWSSFTGTLIPSAVDGRFTFNNSYGIPNGTMKLNSGVSVHTVGQTYPIGEVTGTGSLSGYISLAQSGSGTATWNVGGKNTDFTFDGIVTGGATKFNKVGTGTMTVTGLWDNTGAVGVNKGTLIIKKSTCLGTGALTIANGATLMGQTGSDVETNGFINNSSVTVNGTLYPAASETSNLTSNIMMFNKQNVTVSNTGMLRFNIRTKATSTTTKCGSRIYNINTLALNNCKISIRMIPGSSWTPAVGDDINLWDDVTTVTGNPTIVSEPYKGMIYTFAAKDLAEGLITITGIFTVGDVNGDGKVTLIDANMVINHLYGKTAAGFNALVADLDGDGVITKADADLIVKQYLTTK